MSTSLSGIRIPVSRPSLGPAEAAASAAVLANGWLSIGGLTRQFEETVAAECGAPHVVAVSSGSAALHLALESVLQPGDEVLAPSFTFAATIQMIAMAGGKPVFCDVEEGTLNLDPADAERRITQRTRAILPVHYAGRPCNMDRLRKLADVHGLVIVDDAAHAFGSSYKGRPVGTLADLTCFSFGPVKNITCGEGGAVATANAEFAREIELRRNLGLSTAWSRAGTARAWDYTVETSGYRYPMANLNAAIGLAQLERFGEMRKRKREIVRSYQRALSHAPGLTLFADAGDEVCQYIFPVRIHNGRRDELAAHLRAAGIGSSVHYRPVHHQAHFGSQASRLPVTEAMFGEVLSLPLYADMTVADADEVIARVTRFLRGALRRAS